MQKPYIIFRHTQIVSELLAKEFFTKWVLGTNVVGSSEEGSYTIYLLVEQKVEMKNVLCKLLVRCIVRSQKNLIAALHRIDLTDKIQEMLQWFGELWEGLMKSYIWSIVLMNVDSDNDISTHSSLVVLQVSNSFHG